MRKLFYMMTIVGAGIFLLAVLLPTEGFAQEQIYGEFAPPVIQSEIQPATPSPAQDDVVVPPASADKRPDAERPVLGVIFMPAENGMKVQSVFTNGPLYLIEVFTNDVVTKLDDVEVRSQQDVHKFLIGKKPGDTIRLTRVRGDKSQELTTRLISQEKLLKVSNTKGDAQANISRQYVGEAAIVQPYRPDVLLKVDSRLESMQREIESLRNEIKELRKATLEDEKKSDGDGT